MAGDWIKLHRKLLDSVVMQHPGICQLWVYCLLRANWREKVVMMPGTLQPIKLARGQFITGRRALHAALYPDRDADGKKLNQANSPSESTVWRWLETLETWRQVELKSEQRFTVVTVCNYAIYQDDDVIGEQTCGDKLNNSCTTDEQLMHTEEERKKERKNTHTHTHAAENAKTEPIDPGRQVTNDERREKARLADEEAEREYPVLRCLEAWDLTTPPACPVRRKTTRAEWTAMFIRLVEAGVTVETIVADLRNRSRDPYEFPSAVSRRLTPVPKAREPTTGPAIGKHGKPKESISETFKRIQGTSK